MVVTIAVIYNGGRLQLDLDPNQTVADIVAAVAGADQRYAGGTVRLAWPRDSSALDPGASIRSCLYHGDTVIASYPAPSAVREPVRPDQGPSPAELKMCRICHDSETTPETGRFISPCKCSGSMRFVHVDCLNQ